MNKLCKAILTVSLTVMVGQNCYTEQFCYEKVKENKELGSKFCDEDFLNKKISNFEKLPDDQKIFERMCLVQYKVPFANFSQNNKIFDVFSKVGTEDSTKTYNEIFKLFSVLNVLSSQLLEPFRWLPEYKIYDLINEKNTLKIYNRSIGELITPSIGTNLEMGKYSYRSDYKIPTIYLKEINQMIQNNIRMLNANKNTENNLNFLSKTDSINIVKFLNYIANNIILLSDEIYYALREIIINNEITIHDNEKTKNNKINIMNSEIKKLILSCYDNLKPIIDKIYSLHNELEILKKSKPSKKELLQDEQQYDRLIEERRENSEFLKNSNKPETIFNELYNKERHLTSQYLMSDAFKNNLISAYSKSVDYINKFFDLSKRSLYENIKDLMGYEEEDDD